MARIWLVFVLLHVLYSGKDVDAQITKPFEINDWLNVSCSKNSVGSNVQWPGGLGPIITKIVLSRTPHDTGVAEELATYNANALPGNFEITTKTGDGWFYEMEGGQNSGDISALLGNSGTMRLDLKINGPKCNDAAVYRCSFTYYDTNSQPVNTPLVVSENATWISPVSKFILEKSPYTTETTAVINSNVTFRCFVNGPDKLEMEWSWKQCPLNDFANPIWMTVNDADVVNAQPTIKSTSCTSTTYPYRTYSSIYSFVMRDNICGIRCSVFSRISFSRELEVSDDLVIVPETAEEEQEQAAREAGSSGDDLGLILGLVFGLLALIIIVLLLVYFCWYRKREAPEDKYRDTEDSASKPGQESYVPPPVYYTKPSKPESDIKDNITGIRNDALDNSFDSRDSANRGPPRYQNAPPDDVVVAKRYDTDAYQGRANRAYDGDRSMDDTDNYRYRRDEEDGNGRDDRQYHRRSNQDRRRRRHSNDDDGTANVVPSYNLSGDGDPNLGTAI